MLWLAALLLGGCGAPAPPSAVDTAAAAACAPHHFVPADNHPAESLAPGWDLLDEHSDFDLPYALGPGVALGDFDGDGYLDAFLAVGGVTGSFGFHNDGTGRLVRTEQFTADGGPLPRAESAATADLDGDGDIDVVVSSPEGSPDLLLLNDGTGAFTTQPLDATVSSGEGITPTVVDIDQDGNLDIFISGFARMLNPRLLQAGLVQGDGNVLYRGSGDGHFVPDLAAIPSGDGEVSLSEALTYQAQLIDHDGDGDMGLYLANDFGTDVVFSALLDNEDGQLRIDSDCLCDSAQTAMNVAVGDPNGDGHPDMWISDWGHPSQYYLNDGTGRFYNATASASALPAHMQVPGYEHDHVAWGAAFADMDRDGWEDLLVTFGPVHPNGTSAALEEPDAFLRNNGDGSFTDASAEVGFTDTRIGRSLAIGDLDRDGRPDVVVAGRLYLASWLGAGGCDTGLTLHLDAGPGNRHGIGARVEVTVGDQHQVRWLSPSVVFGASAPEVYVGLAGAAQADRVTVTWPGGAQTTLEDVPAGTVHITP